MDEVYNVDFDVQLLKGLLKKIHFGLTSYQLKTQPKLVKMVAHHYQLASYSSVS